MQIEIEKVRKRRDEREAEKARTEEEAAYLNRERAVAEGIELEKKEELVRRFVSLLCLPSVGSPSTLAQRLAVYGQMPEAQRLQAAG